MLRNRLLSLVMSTISWVMRDVDGFRPTPLWPYFKREQDVASLRRGEPIPVNSCWNGITIFDAKWFLPTLQTDANATPIPGPDGGPLRFRTHPECLVSECLLPSYDIHIRSKEQPLIFVNPRAVASEFLAYCSCFPPRSAGRCWAEVLTASYLCSQTRSLPIPGLPHVRRDHAIEHRQPLESHLAGPDQPFSLRLLRRNGSQSR